MTEQDLVTCHCIIGHPNKPKFLVVKHKTNWAPPVLQYEPGPIDYRADMVSFGMLNKYGLKTRVLRPLVETPRYHCIELELPEQALDDQFRAVWVDIDDYSKFRGARGGKRDIFEDWLIQKTRGEVPPQRTPWQKAGWFDTADGWIRDRLEQEGIEVLGEVLQYRVGWNASCLLAAPTSSGTFYFKAAYAKPPAEAVLTRELAELWPQQVVRPTAVDEENNWMLNRDYARKGSLRPDHETLPVFASTLARLQLESAAHLEKWNELGCPDHGLDYVMRMMDQKDDFLPHFQAGEKSLSDDELRLFAKALSEAARQCSKLREIGIPDTLVHQDFRIDNLVLEGGDHYITDWAGAVTGHPFFALGRMYSGDEQPTQKLDSEAVKQAYLRAFGEFGSGEELEQAFKITLALFPFWRMCHALDEIAWTEKNSPRYWYFQALMQVLARDLISAQAG